MNRLKLPAPPAPLRTDRAPRLTRRPRMWRVVPLRARCALWLAMLATLNAGAAEADSFGWEVRNAQQDWLPQLAMDTSVDIQVHGLIAKVSITQHYENGSQAWQEGRYLLPRFPAMLQ